MLFFVSVYMSVHAFETVDECCCVGEPNKCMHFVTLAIPTLPHYTGVQCSMISVVNFFVFLLDNYFLLCCCYM